MPKLSPKSIAYDRANDRAVLYATHGKDKYLLAIERDMKLRVLRKLQAPSETFWIAGDRAVFWAIDKTVIVPLAEDAKTKTVKHEDIELETAFVPEPAQLHALMGDAVVKFENDAWVKTTFDGHLVRARLDGVTVDGKQVAKYSASRASVSASGDKCLVGLHGGEHLVIGADGSNPRPVELDTIWCSIGRDGGFFAWSNYRVFEVDFDGKTRDTGITKDQEADDTCLFRCGAASYFIQGKTIHRHAKGAWTKHDVAKAGGAIGLA